MWVPLVWLTGVSAVTVADSFSVPGWKHQRDRTSLSAVYSITPPSPLCVISFISCGHVSPAVLTQSAQGWGLNPCHCPSPKPQGSSQGGILCHSFNRPTSALMYLPAQGSKHIANKHLHSHRVSVWYGDTVPVAIWVVFMPWWTHTWTHVIVAGGQVNLKRRVRLQKSWEHQWEISPVCNPLPY